MADIGKSNTNTKKVQVNNADFAVDGCLLLVTECLQFTLNRCDVTLLVYKATRTSLAFGVQCLLTLML